MSHVERTDEARKANRRGAARLAAVQALYQMDIAATPVNEIFAEFESHWIGREVDGSQYLPAEAAFYLMLRVEDMGDATEFCKRLVVEGRVGLAPGTAFGAGGEQYVRLCYAQSPERIGLAMDRLAKFLSDR